MGTPPALNRPITMNSGILLKCQDSDKVFPIKKRNAQKSNYLKRELEANNEALIEIPGNYCSKGLTIAMNFMNGQKLKITNDVFINVFPLASRLDIRELHRTLIQYFLRSESKWDLIYSVEDFKSRQELEKIIVLLTNLRRTTLVHNWIWILSGQEHLILSFENLNDVSWITDALNSGGLRHLQKLSLEANQISNVYLNPEYPLSLRTIDLRYNHLQDVDSIVNSLNEGRLPYLTLLMLAYNQITDFPIAPKHYLSLSSIHLENNLLLNVDALAMSLDEGKLNPTFVNISANPIESWAAWRAIRIPITHLTQLCFEFKDIMDFDDIQAIKEAKDFMPNLHQYWKSCINQAFASRMNDILPTMTLKIQRSNLYLSSRYTFLLMPNINLKKIKIRYTNEISQDVGGLTRDFVHRLSLEMVKQKYGIFQAINMDEYEMSGQKYYFNRYDAEKEADYLFIGRFIAFAYVKRVPLSIEFPPIFYTLLAKPDSVPNFADYIDYDSKHFLLMKRIKQRSSPDELRHFSFCVGGESISDKYDCDTEVNPDNEEDFFNAYANYMIKSQFHGTIHAISKGFKQYFSVYQKKSGSPYPHIVKKILTPALMVDVSDLISHTTFKGFNPQKEHQMKQFYTKMLMEWDETKEGKEKIESLVLFIRGSKLPMTGWRGIPNITFQKRAADGIFLYPVAHTCFYTLDIQPYATKEAFEEGINASLNAFKLSGGIMSIA